MSLAAVEATQWADIKLQKEETMRFLKSSVLAIAAGVLALSIAAQQSNTSKGQQMQGMQQGQMQSGQMMRQGQKMSMREMMRNCRSKMQSMMGSMMQSNDQVKKDIEAAKESNDPARMRAALDEAEKSLNSVDDHTNTRPNMMQGPQGMCGMGGSNMP